MRHLTWWPLIAWRCSAPCHQRPPDWRIYNKWQPTAITLWYSSVIYQQHHNVMISACHQSVNGIGVYTAVARWSSWPLPPVSLHVWHRVLSFARFIRRAAPGSAGWMPEATSCSMMCSWKLLKCIVKRCIWCEIKFCGKKKNIRHIKSQTYMSLILSCNCLCPIHWSHVLSREWRPSWSSADRQCSK